jgi:hypothetical protein
VASVFYESGLSINVMYTIDDKLSDGSRFKFARQKSKLPQVKRICEMAGVPKVSAHAMRGLHGTLAVDADVTSHLVASDRPCTTYCSTNRISRSERLDGGLGTAGNN